MYVEIAATLISHLMRFVKQILKNN